MVNFNSSASPEQKDCRIQTLIFLFIETKTIIYRCRKKKKPTIKFSQIFPQDLFFIDLTVMYKILESTIVLHL